ncbi:MAG: patatin-like phospholipase family protein [Bernardetiaceae bacterium]|nr:patatin-like phospholipase family protein [Bernardetiaceae bacterium]
MLKSQTKPKRLDLALQGGGAHGAFTWGVLERLLEDERLEFDGVCGTSAGAMNALMLTYGWQQNGRQGAIDMLHKFWKLASQRQYFSLFQTNPLDVKKRQNLIPSHLFLDFFTMFFSPYQFNPMNINPLKDILLELVDFEALRKDKEGINLFVGATNVRTGQARVFKKENMTADAVLASACLPFLFKAVEIDGEAYWDGGYMGNPPLYPLIDNTNTPDILIVQINPIRVEHVPRTVEEIRDRINELSFNSSLMHDMRQIKLVREMLAKGLNIDGKFKDLYIHNINPEKVLAKLGATSKLNANWNFLQSLRDIGRDMAGKWLESSFELVGEASSCDLVSTFFTPESSKQQS